MTEREMILYFSLGCLPHDDLTHVPEWVSPRFTSASRQTERCRVATPVLMIPYFAIPLDRHFASTRS